MVDDKDRHVKRANELRDELKLLCEKYEEFSMVLVIEDYETRSHIEVMGNCCPVCALEDLAHIIETEGLTHQRQDAEVKH